MYAWLTTLQHWCLHAITCGDVAVSAGQISAMPQPSAMPQTHSNAIHQDPTEILTTDDTTGRALQLIGK